MPATSLIFFRRSLLSAGDILPRFDQAINKAAGTTSFVIDCEAVAWDKEYKRLLPFQELSRRKSKDVKAEDIKVKVHLFAFDLLYLNGRVSASASASANLDPAMERTQTDGSFIAFRALSPALTE